MSSLNRLARMAKQALNSSSGSGSSSSGSDWRSMVRQAADAITGEDSATGRTSTRTTSTGRIDTWDGSGSRDRGTSWDRQSAEGAAASPRDGDFQRSFTEHSADLTAEDKRAISRYDYLVRTADPEQLEQVHREAFARLTPQQRAEVQARMDQELPASERPRSDSPDDLARSATRLGAMDPRRLEGLLGGSGARRAGMGALAVGGGLLAAVAGGAVVTAVGGSLLQSAIGDGVDVDALAGNLDVGDLGGVEGLDGLSGLGEGFGDSIGGGLGDLGDQISGFGDQVSGFGLDDLFG
ncbi:hypothetical protein [Brachybacterium squillarum]|uniref:hypothetical protein n=1 Tax=Brachybacterium squillarum TaxID=661979 RepID=UPI000262A00C|nr:hypothetical protein [Brachybacterium squillarum]